MVSQREALKFRMPMRISPFCELSPSYHLSPQNARDRRALARRSLRLEGGYLKKRGYDQKVGTTAPL